MLWVVSLQNKVYYSKVTFKIKEFKLEKVEN